MSKATAQRLSERMATRTPPAAARGAPRPPQEHLQPLPTTTAPRPTGHRCHQGIPSTAPGAAALSSRLQTRAAGERSGKPQREPLTAAAGPTTTGPRFPSGRPPSGQAQQGNGGERGGRRGAPRHTRRRPPGTHLRPAAEAGPRGPGSLRGEPGPSRSCSPRDPFAASAPPSPEAKEPAAAGAAPRPRAPAGVGASRNVTASSRRPAPPRRYCALTCAAAGQPLLFRGGGAYAYVTPAVLLSARDRLLRKSGRWVCHVVEAALRPPS